MGDTHNLPQPTSKLVMWARISVVYAQMLCVIVLGAATGAEVSGPLQNALSAETAADNAAFYRIYRQALLAENNVSPEAVLLELESETADPPTKPRQDKMDGGFNRWVQDSNDGGSGPAQPSTSKSNSKWESYNYLRLHPKSKSKARGKKKTDSDATSWGSAKWHDRHNGFSHQGFNPNRWGKSTMQQDDSSAGAPMGHPLLRAADIKGRKIEEEEGEEEEEKGEEEEVEKKMKKKKKKKNNKKK